MAVRKKTNCCDEFKKRDCDPYKHRKLSILRTRLEWGQFYDCKSNNRYEIQVFQNIISFDPETTFLVVNFRTLLSIFSMVALQNFRAVKFGALLVKL